jgi:TIGR03009 family protein
MPRSRTILLSPLIAVFASSFAWTLAQDRGADRAPAPTSRRTAPPEAARPAPDPARMERLLKLWEGQSAKLKTLDVRIYRVDKTPAWNEENHYEGRAVFKSPELAYLDFRKIQTAPDARGKIAPVLNQKDNKWVTAPHETVICNGKEVWQYLSEVRQVFIYPLDKEQRKRALDEGPLPFLFNMKAEEAKRRYGMSLQGEDDKSYFVVIQPRLQEDQESFKTAWIFLDRNFLLPLRIVLFSPDNKSSKDFRLSGHRANKEVGDEYFQGGVPARKPNDPRPPWKVIRNPEAQGRPPRGNLAAPARQPAGQSTMRPATSDLLPRR